MNFNSTSNTSNNFSNSSINNKNNNNNNNTKTKRNHSKTSGPTTTSANGSVLKSSFSNSIASTNSNSFLNSLGTKDSRGENSNFSQQNQLLLNNNQQQQHQQSVGINQLQSNQLNNNNNNLKYNTNRQQQQLTTTTGVASNSTYSLQQQTHNTLNTNNNQLFSNNNHSNELNNKSSNTAHTGEMSYQAQIRNIPPAAPFMQPQQQQAHQQYQAPNRVAPSQYTMPNQPSVVVSNQPQPQQQSVAQQSTTPQSANPAQQQQQQSNPSQNRAQVQTSATPTSSQTPNNTQQAQSLLPQTGQQQPQPAQYSYDNQSAPGNMYNPQQTQRASLISTAPMSQPPNQSVVLTTGPPQQQGAPAQSYGYYYPGGPLFYQESNNTIPLHIISQTPYGAPGPQYNPIYPPSWAPPQQPILLAPPQPQQSQGNTQQGRYQNEPNQQQAHLSNNPQGPPHHQNPQHHLANQQMHMMQPPQQATSQQTQLMNPVIHPTHGQQPTVPGQPIYVQQPQFQPQQSMIYNIPMVGQNNIAPPMPQPQPYTTTKRERERKPLLIIDPATKQVVNTDLVKLQESNKENNNLTKSSTQPSISNTNNVTTTNNNTTSSNSVNRSTTSSNSISSLSSSNTISNITNNTTSTTITVPTPTPTPTPPNTTVNKTNESNQTTTNNSTTANKTADSSNQTPTLDDKKKDDIRKDFALQVLKTKQETDKQTSSATVSVLTGLQQPTNSSSTTSSSKNNDQPTDNTPAPTTTKAVTVSAQKVTENKQPQVQQQTQQQQQPPSKTTPQVESKPVPPVESVLQPSTNPTTTSAPQPPKPISYSNIVASTVPKTAIATRQPAPVIANQNKPQQQDSKSSTSVTTTNRSSSDNNNNKPKQVDQMNNQQQQQQQTATTESVNKPNKESDNTTTATTANSKPAQSTQQASNKTNNNNNQKIASSKSSVDINSKSATPTVQPTSQQQPITSDADNNKNRKLSISNELNTTNTSTTTTTPTIVNEEVKQTVNRTVTKQQQPTTTTTTTTPNEAQLNKDKKVDEPAISASTTMPALSDKQETKQETQQQQSNLKQQQQKTIKTSSTSDETVSITTNTIPTNVSTPTPTIELTTPPPPPPPQQQQTQAENITSDLNCWTPENKDAKKRYDREFLLSLKDKKLSKQFPEALVNFELAVHEIPSSIRQQSSLDYSKRGSMGGSSQGYQESGSFHRASLRRGQGSQNIKKPSMGGMDHQPPAVINITSDVQIKNRAEKPYIPKKLANQELNESEDLFREVRNILNKLTPQNIQKLTGNLINLSINTEDRLKGAIDIIFEKSIDEQVFSQTYAQLCKVLSSIKVPSNADPSKSVNFRTMLLTRCQKEFDTDYYTDISYDKLIAEVEQCTDETKKRELRELAEEKLAKAKRRSLGNIRFIGELFKLSMLTEGIMNDCIERLLKQETDEENLECLCRLLTTIGKEVDKPNNATKMKSYFERLERITKRKESVTARIRFMILDVIDLRKSNWVPRRKDNKPRPLEEIRKEAEEEQQRLEAEIAKNQQNDRRGQMSGQKGGPSGQRGSTGYGQHSMLKSSSMDSEAFNLRNQKPTNMVKKITEVKQITNTTTNNSDFMLGPGGGSKGFGWNKAAAPKQTTTDSTTSSTTPSTTLTSSASFSVNPSLSSYSKSSIDSYDRHSYLSGGGSINSSTSSTTQGNLPSSGVNKLNKQHSGEMTSRLSMDSNRGLNFKGDRQVQSVKKMDGLSYPNLIRSETSSQTSSRETSVSRPSLDSRDNSRTRNSDANNDDPTNVASSSSVKSIKYTDEEIERKATNTIEEYIQNKDVSEALKDCEEFKPVDPSQYVNFIEFLIQTVLERSDNTRSSVGVLFYNIIKEKKFDIVHIKNAFKNVFEFAEDMLIDIPLIATYLSQIIAPLFQKDISVEFLSEACEPIKDKEICANLISEILHQASNRLGHNTVVEIFKKSNLNIHDFLKGVNSTDFIKKKNLTWVLGNRERTQSGSVSTESYERKLFQILKETELSNETIFDKIEAEFGEYDCQSKAFIRAIVTAVCRSCLDSNIKIDPSIFKTRSAILSKYINRNEEFELEALFALQALDHKMQHQPAFIRLLFDIFYDEDIISENVFWKWQKEGREEGHAISALSLKSFYEWLSEPEPN